MKTLVNILIFIAVACIGWAIGKKFTESEDEKKNYGAAGSVFALLLVGFYFLVRSVNTINYTLYHKGRRVYDGITKQCRLGRRLGEHRASGKVFDNVIYSSLPTFRSEAASVERARIRKFRPVYNVQHNSGRA